MNGCRWKPIDDAMLLDWHTRLRPDAYSTHARRCRAIGHRIGRTAGAVGERMRRLGLHPPPKPPKPPKPTAVGVVVRLPGIRCPNCGDVRAWAALPDVDPVELAEAIGAFCVEHSRCSKDPA